MAGIRGGPGSNPRAGTGSALSLRRFSRSLAYAWAGLNHVFFNHANLRLELLLMLLCLLLAVFVQASPVLILLSWGVVMSVEIVNTAVELTVDLISPGHNELAGLAKDVSAAAVLIAALTTAVVNIAVLLPPLLSRIGLVN